MVRGDWFSSQKSVPLAEGTKHRIEVQCQEIAISALFQARCGSGSSLVKGFCRNESLTANSAQVSDDFVRR